MLKIQFAFILLAAFAAFTQEWQFPDGSKVSQNRLPGWLISDNQGMFGNFQKRSGMKILAAGNLKNKEVLRDSLYNFGPTLPPVKKKIPGIILEFPSGASLREIHLAADFADGPGCITVFTSPDGKSWTDGQPYDLPQEKKYHRLKTDLKDVRFLGLSNTGKKRLRITELQVWGDCPEAAAPRASGILQEMLSRGERKTVLPTVSGRVTGANYTPQSLGSYKKVNLFQFRKLTPEEGMFAYLAFNQDGLSVIFPHEHDGRKFRSLAILVNRNDLAAGQYYQFNLTPDGKIRTDASRVIDPAKGGMSFIARAENAASGNSKVSIVQIPLKAMTEDGRFDHYLWSFSLIADFHQHKGRRYTFPSVQSYHAPAQFSLLEAKMAVRTAAGSSWQGIDRTSFTRGQLENWRNCDELRGKKLAVAETALENGSSRNQPLLPRADLNRSRSEVMTRTEVENLCWFAVNPLDCVQNVRISFDGFRASDGKHADSLSTELGTVGVVEMRNGPELRPVFMQNNFPGRVSLHRYIRNASAIEAFPVLKLQPGEAACVILRVRSENALPGIYQGNLHFGETVIPVTVKILDLTLERPREVWNNGHSMPTILRAAMPVTGDYAVNEAQYYYDCGINVMPVNPADNPAGLAEIRAKMPNMIYYFRGIGKYSVQLKKRQITPETFTPEMQQDILKQVKENRDRLLAAGFDYSCWFMSLIDEPGVNETAWAYGKIAELIKKFDSRIQIYCNPCCWQSSGFASAEEILKAYSPWYNRYVDISYPIAPLYFGWGKLQTAPLRRLWDAPRRFNGTYIHPCPGRIQAWKAFFANQNAWGFYSMFQPRQQPWNDFDSVVMDYQSIYPGVNGPVFTVISEQTREAWEDYCMLTMLKKSGKAPEVLKKLQDSLTDPSILDTVPELDQSPWRTRRRLLLESLSGRPLN
ncbi:MAG: hypothetical protein E7055_02725 [Lentisphaerae bacterium]|nr:hypothetical protein [Lentisphaerota bacterium]